jgi:hypothetical protein
MRGGGEGGRGTVCRSGTCCTEARTSMAAAGMPMVGRMRMRCAQQCRSHAYCLFIVLRLPALRRLAPVALAQGKKIAPVCDAAGVKAFPTWVIGGKTLEAELTLDEVEAELLRAEQAAP